MPKWQQEVRISKRDLLAMRGKEETEEFIETRKQMLKEHLVRHVVNNLTPGETYSIKYEQTSHDDFGMGESALILRGIIELNPSTTMNIVSAKAIGPVQAYQPVYHAPPPPKSDPRAVWGEIRNIELE